MGRFSNLSDEQLVFELMENAGIDLMAEALVRLLTRDKMSNIRLGPKPNDEEMQRETLKAVDDLLATASPVDRSKQQLVSGDPVPEDRSHTEIKDNGQQKDYVVLTPEERSKGFVRSYRDAYRHKRCGKITTMGRSLAETYARDPGFYTGTFCATCHNHFPVGEDGEFTWYEMDGREGPKVGT